MEHLQDRRLFRTCLLLSAGLHLALAGAGVVTGWGRTLAPPAVLEVKLVAPAPAPGEGLGSPPAPGGSPQSAMAPALPPPVKKNPVARPRPAAPPPEAVKAATPPVSPASPSLALAVAPRPVNPGTATFTGNSGGLGNGNPAPGQGSGGGPGGGGSGLGNGRAGGDYLGLIRSRILAQRQYPARAREKHQEGVVRVRFRLSASGGLSRGVEVVKPSGYSLLDEQARQCVLAAAPFPPLPRDLKQDHLTIEVPIVYRLTEGE
jgi:protein TonB